MAVYGGLQSYRPPTMQLPTAPKQASKPPAGLPPPLSSPTPPGPANPLASAGTARAASPSGLPPAPGVQTLQPTRPPAQNLRPGNNGGSDIRGNNTADIRSNTPSNSMLGVLAHPNQQPPVNVGPGASVAPGITNPMAGLPPPPLASLPPTVGTPVDPNAGTTPGKGNPQLGNGHGDLLGGSDWQQQWSDIYKDYESGFGDELTQADQAAASQGRRQNEQNAAMGGNVGGLYGSTMAQMGLTGQSLRMDAQRKHNQQGLELKLGWLDQQIKLAESQDNRDLAITLEQERSKTARDVAMLEFGGTPNPEETPDEGKGLIDTITDTGPNSVYGQGSGAAGEIPGAVGAVWQGTKDLFNRDYNPFN